MRSLDRILEVAKGVQYIHSRGIVHGNLCGENVLLDSNFRCQISGFGSARISDATAAAQSSTPALHHSAPELLGVHNQAPTDVYAFGCLYYSIYFNTTPYQEENNSQIIKLVTNGLYPSRLDSPPMDDDTWDLIQRCWMYIPSQRPTMDQIVVTHTMLAPLPLLLATLSEMATLGDPIVNEQTIQLMHKVLDLRESLLMVSEISISSDIESFLDFLLDSLRGGNLRTPGIPKANRNLKARRLMSKLISMTNTIPRSLFIDNVAVRLDSSDVGIGGFGQVFKGEYEGKPVAVKELYRVRNKQDSPRQHFSREAITWRSLSHRFILPLIGIFEEASRLLFVSPFMTNGTLTEWRSKEQPAALEIHRLLLEVAQGFQYIHSEGIVHGDLHGRNILLDSELHCQIADFGLTRHAEATVSHSTKSIVTNYAAPELFGMCIECRSSELSECQCHEGHRNKTMESDVYAFGCLYYATFFGTAPFHRKSEFQIVQLVTSGRHPDRLENPRTEDSTWNLMEDCWKFNRSERPKMDQIVGALTAAFSDPPPASG